jgi:hypothetical protein
MTDKKRVLGIGMETLVVAIVSKEDGISEYQINIQPFNWQTIKF